MKIFSRFIIFAGILAGALCLSLSSCKKEEIPGPKGEPGTPGGGGNSNITSSSNFIVNTSQWQVDSVAEMLKVTITAPELTKDVVEKGGVKVYRQNGSGWSELPFVQGDLFTQFGFSEGVLTLSYINIEGGIASAPPSATYRMVIVKGV